MSNKEWNISSSSTHRSVQRATTLNRKYVKRPTPKRIVINAEEDQKAENPKIEEFHTDLEDAIMDAREISHEVADGETMEDAYPAKDLDETIDLERKVSVSFDNENYFRLGNMANKKKIAVSGDEAPVKKTKLREVARKFRSEEPTKKAKLEEPGPDPLEMARKATKKAIEESKKAKEAEKAAKTAKLMAEKKAAAAAKAQAKKAVKTAEPALPTAKESPKLVKKLSNSAQKPVKPVAKKPAIRKPAPRKPAAKTSARPGKSARVESRPESSRALRNAERKQAARKKEVSRAERRIQKRGSKKRVILALAVSATCVAVLGGLVYLNIPDVSVKVTAMQSGIEAEYPSYVPRDYSLSGVYVNGEDAVVMDFSGPDNNAFSITESSSSWDSNALLNNYVKKTWSSDEYTAMRESGITIYVHNSCAVWVNGGMLYKITAENGVLTKKQIKNIATSI